MQLVEHPAPPSQLRTPVRNRYFYGKLLDAYHFELETGYLNAKRWLINRHVLGYGVVCGLDVIPGDAPHTLCVTPGLAIDKWGREIIVPQLSDPVPIPPDLLGNGNHDHDAEEGKKPEPARSERKRPRHECFVDLHVELCYRECEAEPAPAFNGTCHEDVLCTPGAIREQYRIKIWPGCQPPVDPGCRIDHLFENGRLQYEVLARWVTKKNCQPPANDPCVVLANLLVPEGEPTHCKRDWIDTSVRPIVYTNDLLLEIINCALSNNSLPQAK